VQNACDVQPMCGRIATVNICACVHVCERKMHMIDRGFLTEHVACNSNTPISYIPNPHFAADCTLFGANNAVEAHR